MKNSLLVFLLMFAAIRGYGQCTLKVSISSSGPAICSGSSVVLTASASAGTAPYTFVWSTGETTTSISVNKPGTYTVTVKDQTAGCQAVKQSISIVSATAPNAPTVKDVVVCPNSAATLNATAPGGTYQWYDAAVGGNFLATGATYVTPPISTPTTFYVETTLNGCTSSRSAVNVTLPSTPPTLGATVCSGDPATLVAGGGGTYAWYASAAGGTVLGTGSSFTTPPLVSTTTYYVVVTSPTGCVSSPIPVRATVTPPPQAPTASGATICAGNVVSLHASVSSGIIDWFDVPTGGTSLISSPDFTTPVLNTTTTYYVQTTLNTCTSPRTPVTVVVNPVPSNPTIADVTTCSGTSAVLTPTGPGGTYNWYSAAVGGTLLATGTSYTTPVLTNPATYYVAASNGGCTSGRVPVTVNITPAPQPPSASGIVICPGNTATLTASGSTGSYAWYSIPTGGSSLSNNATFTTPVLNANTTYYVETTVNGCTSTRTPVTVTMLPTPAAPTAPGVTVCSGDVASLAVTAPSGNYAWYDAATGGNLLVTGSAYVTPPLVSTTTYYVESVSANGCSSTRTAVTATVTPPPAAPSAGGASICPGSSTTLTATATGTVSWYDAAVGGNLLATGNSFTTPALNRNTTYYIEQAVGTCVSPRASVTVSMITIPSPQFKYSSGTFCKTGVNPSPTINNPAGGVFSASPAGLVFVSTVTGQINLAASASGTYTISFFGGGTCPTTTTADVTITSSPNAQFSYGTLCQNSGTAFPIFPVGASAGVFSSSGGIVFLNNTTGEINIAASTPGVHNITNTIPASGTCPATSFTLPVTVDPTAVVSAGPNQVVPFGTPVTLAGSVSGGASTGTWSGGAGSFSNPNQLNAVYSPAPGETTVTLTLTSADPPGSCGPKTDQMVITIRPQPAAPTITGTNICSGDVATLTPTAPGGTYAWYDALTGGTLLFTGSSFQTPALVSNTTYYVQTTLNGATSTRSAVTVTINAAPAVPTAAGTNVCSGTQATLTASGSTGSYRWYDAATGGNLLSAGATYTTTPLTVPASFYVEAVGTCTSARLKVDVGINPVPVVNSASAGSVCSGSALNYTITSNVPGTTFTWSRAAVANISNPAVSGQTSTDITETLINTSTSPVNVTYVITPDANGCPGTPFNYVVTVNPAPVVTSASAVAVCDETAINYDITFNSPGVSFSWSRAVVPGISNAAISGQRATTIRESLFNTTDQPVDVIYVITYSSGGCTGLTFNLTVTVNPSVVVTSSAADIACSGDPQSYNITSNVPTATYSWGRAAVAGISNPAVSGQTSSSITEALINTTNAPVKVIYLIVPMANGCPGTQFKYTVTVNPGVPVPVANVNSPICIGSTINLQSPIVSKATYNWSGPNGFSSNLQNPTIPNATAANAGVYSLFITVNGCNSVTVNTAPVVINPPPVADAGPDQTICTTAASAQLAGSVTGGTTTGIWSTAGTGTFSPAPNVLNALYLPSAADVAAGSVKLTLASTSKDDCNVSVSSMTITFKSPVVTSAATGAICNGTAQNYTITSDFPTATFSWSRAAVSGISNPAVSGQTTSTITETLINPGAAPVDVIYSITPINNGCAGLPFNYTVTVNPTPATPVATANSPLCVNGSLGLRTDPVVNATYTWTGPNGFSSNRQNPTISNVTMAAAGVYTLYITVNGCVSPSGSVNVVVDQPSTADAGPDQTLCPVNATVQLHGAVTGGTITTGVWSTSGTGTFPAGPNVLDGTYVASAQDVQAGSVTLTLATNSTDGCAISTSSMTVRFQLLTAVTAGPNQSICSQGGAALNGQITIPGGGVWTSSGTGTFNPSASQLNATYIPSAADIAAGSVVLTLTANAPGQCYVPSDKLTIQILPPPTVNAGGTVYVLKGHTVTLNPTVSDENVTYSWSPDIDISSTTVKNPVVTGSVDRSYLLVVTDSRGCVAQDFVNIVVSPEIVIPNTFTPNGDGINDQWNIQGLVAYQQASVDVFDRYGQKVFHSIGYGTAWDGTFKNQQVPYGVYYYIIDPKFSGLHTISGYVTVVR
ncbi:Ig-like domain-containing protein [Mucilaginibacter ginsenosidivorans]|uniref:T9SS type B sorting domain-containing protein n=1 Tax=Mucilaginibacter ginsenosidivorans TaxID=398053 RepID=A0A5B8UVG9_9SPHI|nr:PKD-like domain-containing protein [Mucilaginibacter ginsenosidivorans]QEC62878.1 T9SS type B sorting domain-containing protein [Mucilaginibacter ginsenosidivorans]